MPSRGHIFPSLSDPNHCTIIARLAEDEVTVSEWQKLLEISQSSSYRRLKVLENADLISHRIDGTKRPRRIEPEGFFHILDWLNQCKDNWGRNVERLDIYFDSLKRRNNMKVENGTNSHNLETNITRGFTASQVTVFDTFTPPQALQKGHVGTEGYIRPGGDVDWRVGVRAMLFHISTFE